jgi:adenylate kinase
MLPRPTQPPKGIVNTQIIAVESRLHEYDEEMLLYQQQREKTQARTHKPMTAHVVFVVGGPGAGKGTQCERIVKEFGYVHLSTGDLLRDAKENGHSEDGEMISRFMEEGKLVPIGVVMKLLKKAMEENSKIGNNKFLIDGFPRNQENIDGWNEAFGANPNVKVRFLLNLECPVEVMQARLLERGKTSGRVDDNEESIKKRLQTFVDSTKPVIGYFEKQGLVRTVLSVTSPEDVFDEIAKLFAPKSEIVFVLGGPGSGKGTQCPRIVEKFNYVHLSTGDLLREASAAASADGQLINQHIAEGKLVPIEIVMRLLQNAMNEHLKNGKNKFLIDGFPRNQDNLDAWNEEFGSDPDLKIKFVLYLDCPEQVMEYRLLGRGKKSGRIDDTPEVVKKRFDVFVNSTKPIIQYFDRLGLVRKISASGTISEVFADITEVFLPKTEVVFVIGGPGAGKGTQCEKIVRAFHYVHLSTGDLLRDAKASGSSDGELINQYMADGKLVPIEVVMRLLKNAMARHTSKGRHKFLIDGFPRNQENIDGWTQAFGSDPNVKVKFVLYLECPEDVMESRILERGKTSGRVDDNPEAVKKRLHTFLESTQPIIEHYGKQGLVRAVSSVPAPDVVFKTIYKIFHGKPEVVFVLGGPGAGKGTQCAKIVAKYGYVHLSAGDLLREEQNSGSGNGRLIDSYIREGKIVPVEITVRLLQKAIAEHRSRGLYKFLVDGFPRNQENLDGWYQTVGDSVYVKACLYFECSQSVMLERLLKRGKSSGRADDNVDSIQKRFATFNTSTKPIIHHFGLQGILYRIGADRTVDQVFEDVSAVFDKF